MSKKPEIIIIRETMLQSWISDASSVVGFLALIGIGVYLESNAMQWAGAILGFITICGKAFERDKRMTVAEARKRLDDIEGAA